MKMSKIMSEAMGAETGPGDKIAKKYGGPKLRKAVIGGLRSAGLDAVIQPKVPNAAEKYSGAKSFEFSFQGTDSAKEVERALSFLTDDGFSVSREEMKTKKYTSKVSASAGDFLVVAIYEPASSSWYGVATTPAYAEPIGRSYQD